MKKNTFNFTIHKSKVLNANNIPNHFIVKGKIVNHLRDLGSESAVELHKGKNKKLALLKLEALSSEKNFSLIKKRRRAVLKKEGELSAKEIETIVTEEFQEFAPEVASKDIHVDYPFKKCKVTLKIWYLRNNLADPPNFSPTLKAIEDGFTSGSLWEDDNHTIIVSHIFEYGGISDVKDHYKLTIEVEELD
jgi:crossover junction endodeoxyribonuclease RusA